MIDATVGGLSSNSYVTLAEANAYAADSFSGDAFLALSNADREKCLRQATRQIDRNRFQGVQGTTRQALAFPRAYPYNSDRPTLSTALEIPSAVKDAQCEQALYLASNALTGGSSRRSKLQSEGVTSFRVGSAAETFGRGSGLAGETGLCTDAAHILRHWVTITGRIIVDGREQEDVLGDEIP